MARALRALTLLLVVLLAGCVAIRLLAPLAIEATPALVVVTVIAVVVNTILGGSGAK